MQDLIIILNALYELTEVEEINFAKGLVLSYEDGNDLGLLKNAAELAFSENNAKPDFLVSDRFQKRGDLENTYLQILLDFLEDEDKRMNLSISEFRDIKGILNSEDDSQTDFFKDLSYLILKATPNANQFSLLREGLTGFKKNKSKALSDLLKFFNRDRNLESLEELRKALMHLPNIKDFLNYFLKFLSLKTNRPVFHDLRKALSDIDISILVPALSHGQIQSKKWLLEEWSKIQDEPINMTYVLGGWLGILPLMHFETSYTLSKKFRNFDIDPKAIQFSERICKHLVQDDWKYKGVVMDLYEMKYDLTEYETTKADGSIEKFVERADVIINTSCEHLDDFELWLSKIPFGTRLILQSNNFFAEPTHVNCVESLQAFKEQAHLSDLQFSGTLDLNHYQRFMLIGVR